MTPERPILMCGEMVRATLAGIKTNTRRVMKPQPSEGWTPNSYGEVHRMVNGEPDPDKVIGWGPSSEDGYEAYRCPYAVGMRLWVRETWKPDPAWGFPPDTKPSDITEGTNILYAATLQKDHPKFNMQRWRPSLFMPRWASRITLEIESVRVERVTDISDEDAMAEGIAATPVGISSELAAASYRAQFHLLWDGLNAKRGFSWKSNPWVWVLKFRQVKGDK